MFRFMRDDASVEAGVRRIAVGEVEAALEEIAAGGRANTGEAVHNARKRLKKLRALLRLVRPEFGRFRKENATIRKVADQLSAARDARVLVDTLDSLSKGSVPKAVRALRADLVQEAGQLDDGVKRRRDEFASDIRAIGKRASKWKVQKDGFEAIEGGLKDIYGRAQDGMAHALENPSPVAFHEWRKAVKNHGYQIALLRPTAPDVLKRVGALWDKLGEALGDHHNLAVLREEIEKRTNSSARLGSLRKALDEQSLRLEQEAFELGRQLLVDSPSAMAKRLKTYQRDWRRGRSNGQ